MSRGIGKGRVLSIQSHVTFGYVGGKAAVFPLQCLGYDVDVVNTVSYSNHAGYGRFGGSKASSAELAEIFTHMEQNELLAPERLLTGFNTGAEALSAVGILAAKLKAANPNLIYLLDPVLGDAGRIYVSPDVIPIYRRLLPLATVITPNWFEVELLTEIELKDLPSLRLALRTLHSEYNVPNIVMSSIPLRNWLADALPPQIRPSTADDADLNTEYLLCISSSSEASPDESQPKVHARCVPLLPGYFSGVGDLFSALLLAHYQPAEPHDPAMGKEETPLSHAASFALAKTHSMLCLTDEYARALPEEERMPTDDEKDSVDPLRKTKRMRGRELRLVQGQDILRGIGVANERLRPWKEFWIEHAL